MREISRDLARDRLDAEDRQGQRGVERSLAAAIRCERSTRRIYLRVGKSQTSSRNRFLVILLREEGSASLPWETWDETRDRSNKSNDVSQVGRRPTTVTRSRRPSDRLFIHRFRLRRLKNMILPYRHDDEFPRASAARFPRFLR